MPKYRAFVSTVDKPEQLASHFSVCEENWVEQTIKIYDACLLKQSQGLCGS